MPVVVAPLRLVGGLWRPLLAATGLLAVPSAAASAASIVPHKLPVSASQVQALYGGPQGIVLAAAPPSGTGSIYDIVTSAPTFSLKPGPAGLPAGAIWTGPDGNPWYLGAEAHPGAGGASEPFPTLMDLTAAGPVLSVKDPVSYPGTGGRQISGVYADGATWIANTSGKIEKAASGTIAQVPLSLSALSATSITATADGLLWFPDVVRGSIDELTPEGEAIEHPLPGDRFDGFGNTEPYDIVVGSDGALWFTEENAGQIGRMTEAGVVQQFAIPDPAGGAAPGTYGTPSPRSIVSGPDRALWFTDPGDNAIGRITTSGEVTEFPIISNTPASPDLIVSYGGEIWFSQAGVAALGSVNPAGPTAVPPPGWAPIATTAEVTSFLTRTLSTSAKAKIDRLLKNDGQSLTVEAPQAGRLALEWRTATSKRNQTVVATGSRSVAGSSPATVRLKLTVAGTRLLKHARQVTVSGRASFTPAGERVLRAAHKLALRR